MCAVSEVMKVGSRNQKYVRKENLLKDEVNEETVDGVENEVNLRSKNGVPIHAETENKVIIETRKAGV